MPSPEDLQESQAGDNRLDYLESCARAPTWYVLSLSAEEAIVELAERLRIARQNILSVIGKRCDCPPTCEWCQLREIADDATR